MTVGELKEKLDMYPDDMEVSVLTAYNCCCIAEGKLNSVKSRSNTLYLEYRNPREKWDAD